MTPNFWMVVYTIILPAGFCQGTAEGTAEWDCCFSKPGQESESSLGGLPCLYQCLWNTAFGRAADKHAAVTLQALWSCFVCRWKALLCCWLYQSHTNGFTDGAIKLISFKTEMQAREKQQPPVINQRALIKHHIKQHIKQDVYKTPELHFLSIVP